MKKEVLTSALLAIASANPEGFTVNAQTLEPVAKGYAVAVADTQNSFDREGLARVINFVAAHGEKVNAFGGWFDSESGLFYWDATAIFTDYDDARAFALANDQIAFFDLTNGREIRTK